MFAEKTHGKKAAVVLRLATAGVIAASLAFGTMPAHAYTSKYGEDQPLTSVKTCQLTVKSGHKHTYIDASNGCRYQLYDSCMNGMTRSTPTSHSDVVTIDGVKYSLGNYSLNGLTQFASVIKRIDATGTSANPTTSTTLERPITSITFPNNITIKKGQSLTVGPTVNPANTTYLTNIQWGHQTNNAFTVKTNGYGTYRDKASTETITGTKAGKGSLTTTINVFNSNKQFVKRYSFSTVVNVVENTPTPSTSSPSTNPTTPVKPFIGLNSISLNKTSASLIAGKTMQLSVSYTPYNTTVNKSVSWTSSNSAIASVYNGTVTAKKAGSAVITARVNGKTASCRVTVSAAQTQTPAPQAKTPVQKDGFVNVSYCYTKLNSYRSAKKVAKLKKNSKLEKYAKTRAKELVRRYSHTRPNGSPCYTVIKNRTSKTTTGENIAKGYETCQQVMTGWRNSTVHYKNMVHKSFKTVGIAGYRHNGVIYWVQIFKG